MAGVGIAQISRWLHDERELGVETAASLEAALLAHLDAADSGAPPVDLPKEPVPPAAQSREAQRCGLLIVETARACLSSSTAKWSEKLTAARILQDLGYGRPSQAAPVQTAPGPSPETEIALEKIGSMFP
jgi:hypothetical protein